MLEAVITGLELVTVENERNDFKGELTEGPKMGERESQIRGVSSTLLRKVYVQSSTVTRRVFVG